MRKQTPKLEWQIVENDAEWERQQTLLAQEGAPTANGRLLLQRYFLPVAALLVLLVGGGLWWSEGAVLRPPAAHRQATAQPAPDAVAQSNDWGPARTLATPYFVYHFRQQDAPVVMKVAPEMDALYTTLTHNFGLPITPMPEPLTINVSVTQPPGWATMFDAAKQISVAPPARYLAPVELTHADLLAQSIAIPLLSRMVTQARTQHEIGPYWQPLLNGLSLWHVWDMTLPLATWRAEVVRWLYVDFPTAKSEPAVLLPQRYRELCAAHKLWLWSPLQIYIPLICTERQWEKANLFPWNLADPPTHLDQLVGSTPAYWGRGQTESHPGQAVALATLIEYAVATYGEERLPLLVAGLGQYESWETLIPAVYGVSAAEFEAGWQAYLTAH